MGNSKQECKTRLLLLRHSEYLLQQYESILQTELDKMRPDDAKYFRLVHDRVKKQIEPLYLRVIDKYEEEKSARKTKSDKGTDNKNSGGGSRQQDVIDSESTTGDNRRPDGAKKKSKSTRRREAVQTRKK